jgi:hypothetical protein
MALALIDNATDLLKCKFDRSLVYGLSKVHLTRLTNELIPLAKGWSADAHEDYNGELTVFVTAEREEGPCFMITRSSRGYHLARNSGDDLVEVGCFDKFDDVVMVLANKVASG